MEAAVAPFEYEHNGSDLVYGRGRVREIGDILDKHSLERALIVTGQHVGSNVDVMDPLKNGLGHRLVSIFDQTTGSKRAETVFEGIAAMREHEVDVLIGVGGGSSLDVSRQMTVFASDDRSLSDIQEEAHNQGQVTPPDNSESLTPVVVVPTTFAGADLSSGGSIEVLDAETSPTPHPIRTGGSNFPIAVLYDPDLFETTPTRALAGAAMNGFDKGIETPYARSATPITDGTAAHGLAHLHEGLIRLGEGKKTDEGVEQAVVGMILVQFECKISVIHAFSHGFSRRYDVQQGNVHAVVAPHVLRYLFQQVDGKRYLIGDALGVETDQMNDKEVAEEVVHEVERVRDAFDLPTRLRELPETRKRHLSDIAAFINQDWSMEQAPRELDASENDIYKVLQRAW